MRRGRIFIYLAFILILAVVAVFVVWQRFLQPPPAPTTGSVQPTPQIKLVDVVVATQHISRGTVVTKEVVSTVPFPEDNVIPGMFRSVDEVTGSMAKFDLDSGIPLTKSMLASSSDQLSGTGSLAALSIPPGMVAVSIPVDRLTSVSYAPETGDHVNVIVSMLFADLDTEYQTILPNSTGLVIAPGPRGEDVPPSITAELQGLQDANAAMGRAEIDPVLGQTIYVGPSEAQRPRLVAQTLLQDAVVLKMGDFPTNPEEQTTQAEATPVPEDEQQQQQGQATATPPPPEPERVSLIVSPQDAVTLNYLISSQSARLTLALRSANDPSRVETEAVTLQFLLDQYNIPIPVKLPYGMQPRLDNLSVPALPQPTPVPAP